ncbi:MAG: phosphoribosylglycinamide formyltransferase [Spirochaetales bacterium]|nr:phosphoribosylglycinamide formyltransferase [Spirochaetales bacterium]
MAKLAVLASGNGTNFEALALALEGGAHRLVLLVHDRKDAYAQERAARLGIPSRYVTWAGRSREEAEAELGAALSEAGTELVALAGFMRLLSPAFVERWAGRLVNVHPSVLPAWPGVDSVRRSFDAGADEFGVTVHYVDSGMDTGQVIAQRKFRRWPGATLEAVETRVHELEHGLYPRVVLEMLDRVDAVRDRAAIGPGASGGPAEGGAR